MLPVLSSRTSHAAFIAFFFFNDTATTEIYTLSLHDALPIWLRRVLLPRDAGAGEQLRHRHRRVHGRAPRLSRVARICRDRRGRSEEHTSELQSLRHLVCRLLLAKKKIQTFQERECADTPNHS